MSVYDMKSIGVVGSGVTSSTIIFGAIGGQGIVVVSYIPLVIGFNLAMIGM